MELEAFLADEKTRYAVMRGYEILGEAVRHLPEEVRGDLADALARLDAGLVLSMPLSRSMPSIGRGVHELRLKDRSGTYRIVYALIQRRVIHVLHAFNDFTEGCFPQLFAKSRVGAIRNEHLTATAVRPTACLYYE